MCCRRKYVTKCSVLILSQVQILLKRIQSFICAKILLLQIITKSVVVIYNSSLSPIIGAKAIIASGVSRILEIIDVKRLATVVGVRASSDLSLEMVLTIPIQPLEAELFYLHGKS